MPDTSKIGPTSFLKGNDFLINIIIFIIYVLSTRFGLIFAITDENISLIWPASGITLAALLLYGYRPVPGIMAGAFVSTIITGAPVSFALGTVVTSTLEPVLSTFLLRRFQFKNLYKVKDVVLFFPIAVFISPLIAAGLGHISMVMSDMVTPDSIEAHLWKWWLGNALGVMIITPVLLNAERLKKTDFKTVMEFLLCSVMLIVFCLWVFYENSVFQFSSGLPYFYLTLPLMLYPAFRFGHVGASISSFIISCMAVHSYMHGLGPFVSDNCPELTKLSLFIASSTFTSLMAAALYSERSLSLKISKQSEQRFDTIIKAADLGFWEWDVASKELVLNDRWFSMLGYERDDLVSNSNYTEKLIHPEDLGPVRSTIRNHLKGLTDMMVHEYRMKTKAGSYKWVLYRGRVTKRDETGMAISASGTQHDITERKNKEAELKKLSDELTRHNNELQQFAYITSHDLRAPVVNMVSLLNILNKDNPADPENKEVITMMESSIKRLHATLNDLIEIVDINKKINVRREEFDPHEVLNYIIGSLSSQIDKTQVVINRDFSEVKKMDYPSTHFQSILLNLLTNSIKYRRENVLCEINIKLKKIDTFVLLEVRDNGRGIDLEKNKDKIFKLYKRFHTGVEGRGLGLYLIKTQVEALGGKVEVESIPGEGTLFKIYLKNAFLE